MSKKKMPLLYQKFLGVIKNIHLDNPPSKKKRQERERLCTSVPRKFKLTKQDVKDVANELDEWGLGANKNLKKLFFGDKH